MWGEGIGESRWCKYCVHMYVNGKMRDGERRLKENDGGSEFNYDIL
jgi:hypothetical protein